MSFKKIACCIDLAKTDDLTFKVAFELAQKYRAKLYVVHVLAPLINFRFTGFGTILLYDPKKVSLSKLKRGLRAEYLHKIKNLVDFEMAVLDGNISSMILKYLKEKQVDLVVLGASSDKIIDSILSDNVTKNISVNARCSVMIVKKISQFR